MDQERKAGSIDQVAKETVSEVPDEEALVEWVERKGSAPRPDVIAHVKASIAHHRALYQELAQ